MTIKERIKYITELQQDQCWYITKHNLNFKQLCFSAQIVELYQNSDMSVNFADFYNEKAPSFNLSQNHRATNNCYYIGLLENNGQYKDAKPTNAYFELKESVKGDFSKLNLTDDLVVSQLEKTFISNPIDREYDGLRKRIRINPAFFLARVLISIGEITNDYLITLDEFYLFIGTSETYKDHYVVTQLILEHRSTPFNISNKFTNNRLHLLLENLPYFSREANLIKLNTDYKNSLLKKIYQYETLGDSEVITTTYLQSRTYTTKFNSYLTQKIYYGAPGTGKSYKVNELLKGKEEQTERVTFHPEYDYVSFIGGFKPITEVDAESGKEEIKYKFVPQTFTSIYVDAWNNKDNEYYLVIEEINRGNCAEIFGDIFQLLDRNSDYSITPSNELKQYLVKELTSVGGIKGIENGKMKLPSNLNILATMNTSDQSLFPMDSAFKRRWDWEYIPINYEKSEENPSSNYQVVVSGSISFSWLEFIEKVNTIIKENPNLGMDKCIGNYFIKAKDNIITLEDFINKAIFYLWNDVFKDEDDHIFEENTFYEDFFPISTKGKEKVLKVLEKIGLNTPKKED